MRVAYRELPHEIGRWPRPLIDISVGDAEEVRVRCLADSGAVNTLLPGWVADLAGIDCADAPTKSLGVAGTGTTARMVTTLLTIGEHSWEADIGFCDPWPRGWGLLGQLAFFRFFEVTFHTADFELELHPVKH
ncbi:MAG: retropepsin-like domain-containing protein [Actinomycetota bacterium]|nr:retropepsin-like domain-containing protein [Actinomycetota bacterium]